MNLQNIGRFVISWLTSNEKAIRCEQVFLLQTPLLSMKTEPEISFFRPEIPGFDPRIFRMSLNFIVVKL